MKEKRTLGQQLIFILLVVLAALFIFPVLFVLMNSFKGKLYISDAPFALPTGEMFARLENYTLGIASTFGYTAEGRSVTVIRITTK